MQATVIFTTYNQVDWLRKTLWGFACQTHAAFDIVVADDGSTEETRACIETLREQTGLQIKHVWQRDDGFRKTRILNKAILAAPADYLIFTDGDCIPRRDFVATHVALAEPGHFLSGGYFKLPMSASETITQEDIESGQAFDVSWLKTHGLRVPWHKRWKLTATATTAHWLNKITPTRPSWNGHNASGWKADLMAANGFDERMQYGGEDRELGERLINAGIKPKQIRYSAICVHLDHPRGYVNAEARAVNDRIRAETASGRRTRTAFGLDSRVSS